MTQRSVGVFHFTHFDRVIQFLTGSGNNLKNQVPGGGNNLQAA
jgi:hypothetical protein